MKNEKVQSDPLTRFCKPVYSSFKRFFHGNLYPFLTYKNEEEPSNLVKGNFKGTIV